MAKIDVDEFLRNAGHHARNAIPQLESERQILQEQLSRLENKLGRLRILAQDAPIDNPNAFPNAEDMKVSDKIAYCLSRAPGLTPKDIQSAIADEFNNEEVPMPSIYSALQKGEAAGRFERTGGVWKALGG